MYDVGVECGFIPLRRAVSLTLFIAATTLSRGMSLALGSKISGPRTHELISWLLILFH